MNERMIEEIVKVIPLEFNTFGGGYGSNWNPLAAAIKDKPLQFAAGVDVKSVVQFVLDRAGIGKN